MPLSRGAGSSLIVASLAVALAALLVPSDSLAALLTLWGGSSGDSRCPLGYTSGGGGARPAGDAHAYLRPGAAPAPLEGQPAGPAELYVNASAVWTAQAPGHRVDSFAVGPDGRFLCAGAAAECGAAAGPGASVIDLQGHTVIPGLVDAHVHLIPGGLSLLRLDLRAADSRAALQAAVAAAAARLQPGQWLLGFNWDESRWGGELPDKSWVDGAGVPAATPVWLMRMDAHMGLANSAALKLAGVDAATEEPLVARHIPPLTLDERRRGFELGVRHALSRGITLLHDMGRLAFMEGEEAAWEDLEEIYVPAADAGQLPLRLYSFVPLPTWERLAHRVQHLGRAHPGGRLFWGGVKEFADGSLGSRTALMHEPYSDDPSTSGTTTVDRQALARMVEGADAAGLQVAIHAIGDKAVDDVLGIYEAVQQQRQQQQQAQRDKISGGSTSGSGSDGGHPPLRHRIEHAQHLSGPTAARRMAALGVVATPNPLHLLADMPVLVTRLGTERAGAGRTYAFRTLLDAGVRAATASDWPIMPLEPFHTLWAAERRHGLPGDAAGGSATSSSSSSSDGGQQPQAWAPEEVLSRAEALVVHTAAGAYAGGLERQVGSIRAGLKADFVVISSLEEAAPAVLRTYVDGRCAWGCAEGEGERI
eukprot:scaffold1.g5517.t1